MKKLAYGLLVLVALLAGAVFVLPDLIDWNAYKPRISAEVKKAIGRTLTIDGDLDLDVLPAPRLTAFNARLSNAPGAARADMATLRALRIRIEIAPLLRGRLEVAHIEIVQPEIHLERLPDGRANWNLASAAAAVSRQGSERGSGSASGFAFRVNRLTVTNGAVFYRDGRAAEKIEGLSAEVAAESLSGPFSISGSMIARGVPLTFDATVGQVAEGRPVPVSLGARIGGAEVSAKGIASASRASAEVDGEGKNLRTLVALLSGRAAPETPDVPYSFKTNVVAADGRIALNDLKLRLKDSEVSGKASVATGDALRVDVDLKAARIDADSFLTEPRPADAATGGRPDGGQQAGGAVEAAEIRLPRDVEVNVDLAADEILAGGGSLRNVRLSAALKEGALSLEKFSALLPGDAELGLAGTADEEGGSLRYAGKMSFRSANLRTLLDWFDAAPSGIGADRLRRMTAEADIAGDLSQLRIENIRMQFDASRLEGGVTLALQDRLSFGASLNVDQFNVDAYVSAPQEEESRAPDDRKKTDPEGAPQRGPLSFMEKFDANLAIRVGNFVYRETSVQGMRFDGTLLNGELTVREASLRNLAGVGARAQGKLSGFDGIPAFKGTVSVASEDPGGLLAAFDVESPVPPERLGRIRLSGDVEAAAERVSVDAQVEVAEFSGTLRGFVSDPAADPSFDLRLDGGHPELVRFVALFSDRGTGIQAGGAKLKVSAKGDMDNVALETEIGTLDASLKVAGTVLKPMDAPKFDLNVDFRHPDFVRLVRNFDPAFKSRQPAFRCGRADGRDRRRRRVDQGRPAERRDRRGERLRNGFLSRIGTASGTETVSPGGHGRAGRLSGTQRRSARRERRIEREASSRRRAAGRRRALVSNADKSRRSRAVRRRYRFSGGCAGARRPSSRKGQRRRRGERQGPDRRTTVRIRVRRQFRTEGRARRAGGSGGPGVDRRRQDEAGRDGGRRHRNRQLERGACHARTVAVRHGQGPSEGAPRSASRAEP